MANPYEIWQTRRLLGVMRDVKPRFQYWTSMFTNQMNFDTEFVEFDKLPQKGRKVAPFVRPAGTGKPIYEDTVTSFRFKPAYVKLKDAVDAFRPLTKMAGIDRGILQDEELTPMQRRDLLKTAIMIDHVDAIETRWELMACNAIVSAADVIVGEEYPAQEIDFRRAANHAVVLGAGVRWGDSNVSIFDSIQTYADRMFNAPFGGYPTRLTMTPKVWAVVRKDAEILEHMDTNIRGERATVERGLVGADKVIKVGELMVGGASGAVIELILYRDTYQNEAGVETPFMVDGTAVLTASPDRIMGYQCFGAIVDPNARYQSLPIYPRNWMEIGDPAAEFILHQSAPLMVPVNPNATLKLTPVAP